MNNVGKSDEVSIEMLKKFEEVATEDNVKTLSVLGNQSIRVVCKCGCLCIHHILHDTGPCNIKLSHSQIYYIELCSRHCLSDTRDNSQTINND